MVFKLHERFKRASSGELLRRVCRQVLVEELGH